jgi:protein TonB
MRYTSHVVLVVDRVSARWHVRRFDKARDSSGSNGNRCSVCKDTSKQTDSLNANIMTATQAPAVAFPARLAAFESNDTDRFAVSLAVALLLHAFIILGVSFTMERSRDDLTPTLDIVLVQSKDSSEPEQADYLAQANNDGGGSEERLARPTTPLPSTIQSDRAEVVASVPQVTPQAAVSPVEHPREAVRAEVQPPPEELPEIIQNSTDTQTVRRALPPKPRPRPQRLRHTPTALATQERSAREPLKPQLDAKTLITQTLAYAALSAEVDQKLNAFSSKPRRKWISARTRESKYAAYMEAWRSKVERIGNLNYPDEARRRRLSGNLLLDVAVKPDGSIHDITLRRSSGHRALDDAAVRIVRLAAPFSPFPRSIKRETDILHIERTWQFTQKSRLTSR